MLVNRAKSLAASLLTYPRFNHAERVANLLNNPTEVELAAAYLHDIMEDTFIAERVLVKTVGKEVTDIVKELTNNEPILYKASKIRDYSYMKNASKEAKKIKLADRIDNIKKKYGWVNRADNSFLLEYLEESHKLLGFIKDGDTELAKSLEFHIEELKAKCLNTA